MHELLTLAEQTDTDNVPDGMHLPEEIQRREDRLAAMAAANARIAARTAARYAREKVQSDEKMGTRQLVVEPVFGIIKSVMGFRQFSMRGLDKVIGEWTLVCLA